jgi:hypothetical protein
VVLIVEFMKIINFVANHERSLEKLSFIFFAEKILLNYLIHFIEIHDHNFKILSLFLVLKIAEHFVVPKKIMSNQILIKAAVFYVFIFS